VKPADVFFIDWGFPEVPWEVRALPGGDSYLITLAPVGHTFESEPYPWVGERSIGEFAFGALATAFTPPIRRS